MQILSVLIVDNDQNIRGITEMTLDSEFDVYVARSGADCLVVAESEQPDLILLSVKMPVMNGFTTLIKLRKNPLTAAIPVILMAYGARTHETERYRELDIIGLIEKPCDLQALPAHIRKFAAAR